MSVATRVAEELDVMVKKRKNLLINLQIVIIIIVGFGSGVLHSI